MERMLGLAEVKAQMNPNAQVIEWGDRVMRRITTLGQYGYCIGSFTTTGGELNYVMEIQPGMISYGPAEEFSLMHKARELPPLVHSSS